MTGVSSRARAGLAGIAVVVALVLVVQNLDTLLRVGSGHAEVTAYFTDSSGLAEGDRVEVAGIEVGRVTDVAADGARVRVVAAVDGSVRLGAGTGAAIKVGNLLGSKYLELEPGGPGRLAGPIPLERTEPAYDVVAAVSDLTVRVRDIDTERLGEALRTVAETFRGSAPGVRRAVRGLSDLSATVARRDAALRSLFAGTEQVAASLDGSREDLARFVRSASLLLGEVERQRATIGALVRHSRALADQLRGLVRDNRRQLAPALRDLARVTRLLQRRQDKLGRTLHNLATFSRVFIDTIGSGPWFDSYIANAPDTVTTSGGRR